MQIQKQDIKEKILLVARNEFLIHGYQHISLRNVAKQVNISTSNIYNYFLNKDELFLEILSPTLFQLEFILNHINETDYFKKHDYFSFNINQDIIYLIIDFIDKNRQNIELLLFKSAGSNLYNFKEELVQQYTQITLKQIEELKAENININSEIPSFFVYTVCSFYLNLVSEIIRNKLSCEEMKMLAEDMLAFFYNGWKAVLKF